MTSQCSNIEPESGEGQQRGAVSKSGGILASVFCRISQFWPVSFVVRGVRGLWWLFGFSSRRKALLSNAEAGSSPATRQCRTGRKRLRWASRLLLAILPRRVQGLLGYPVCTSIGCAVSPEVRCSPTKPCGKGSKRKQDDLDEEDEPEQQSWVEALTQELTDEDHAGDPDYEPSAVETDSEEYRSHNDTESDIEVEKGVVVIQDLETLKVPQTGMTQNDNTTAVA
ncbi:oogenesis-related [Salminus brasiliensis]|uniref:oogenesis-related n=1 Tax=Salminus brasiliensis TaxID=930266 RepID=UPI003B82DCB5